MLPPRGSARGRARGGSARGPVGLGAQEQQLRAPPTLWRLLLKFPQLETIEVAFETSGTCSVVHCIRRISFSDPPPPGRCSAESRRCVQCFELFETARSLGTAWRSWPYVATQVEVRPSATFRVFSPAVKSLALNSSATRSRPPSVVEIACVGTML